jgi:hypothetical protein
MPKIRSSGRLRVSTTQPSLFSQENTIETEVKYYGLSRDKALSDLTASDKALTEVLTDLQDPAEAKVLGLFTATDLQIIDGIVRYDLKNEDFQTLQNVSINSEDGSLQVPLVNPRQRIQDRIKQFEGFAGRGTVYQGQGGVLFKYVVPIDELDSNNKKYTHKNPPPFYTEAIDSTIENAPDFIPVSEEEISRTHRVGYVLGSSFIPIKETEWWWNGEYNFDFRDRDEYGNVTTTNEDPKLPIVKDGNIQFENSPLSGIEARDNWGIRIDTWFKKGFTGSGLTLQRFAAQVNGHLRIDYYEKAGEDSNGTPVAGGWKTALDTSNPSNYYEQLSKEQPAPNSNIGYNVYYVQGGPTTPTGTGSGTLPSQRTTSDGGAWDLGSTYEDEEGEDIGTFDNEYVPVVIRFWYGQPDSTDSNTLTRQPPGPASFALDLLTTDLAPTDLAKWNDYSAQLRLVYDSATTSWTVDTSSGGSDSNEANFANFNNPFEILGYTFPSSTVTKPSTIDDYLVPDSLITADTQDDAGTIRATFSLPGSTPANGHKVWIIASNRVFNVFPGNSSRSREELWQGYIFNPSPNEKYETIADLFSTGPNYANPDPKKVPFEENLSYYQAKYAELPITLTYGPSRYDGFIVNSLTENAGGRDYDYNHPTLLMVGRQKKGTEGEIGTTPPYAGKNLQPGEVRNDGENYTFIEVIKNQAGRGGSVIIDAYPSNDMGAIETTATPTYGKNLHMVDNTTTFSNPSRQNISQITTQVLPSTHSSTSGISYFEVDGLARLYFTISGAKDETGIIAKLAMGATSRNHTNKEAFIHSFKNSSSQDFSFYGLIGVLRPSVSSVSITLTTATTFTAPSGTFEKFGEDADQYDGTEIKFTGDNTTYLVTNFNHTNSVVTFAPAKSTGTFTAEIYYNFFQLGATLPTRVVDSSGAGISLSAAFTNPSQIKYVFNGSYQYLRVDNGAGLSFGEVLFVKEGDSPTTLTPFSSDTELPAPPAEIVTPFGYDNGSSDPTNPGLGGLCYPPYSVQNLLLSPIAKSDTDLYASSTGEYDMWWGGRINGGQNLGGRYVYITDKLVFDFTSSQRPELIKIPNAADKVTFSGTEYTHKLPLELRVELPSSSSTHADLAVNSNLYKDASKHSNNRDVTDKYFLFIHQQGSDLNVLTPSNPAWT